MANKNLKNVIYKSDTFMREMLILTIGLTIWLPLSTIRVIAWKWWFWIRRSNKQIRKDHKKFHENRIKELNINELE